MTYRHAWATITGKVFVDNTELRERVEQKWPELTERLEDDGLTVLDVCSREQEAIAFEELAKDKLNALFPTDEPMKVEEIEVDMHTYKS